MLKNRTKNRIVRNLPIILLTVSVIINLVFNIRISSQVSVIEDELNDIEVSNTVIAMSSTKKKSHIVSTKFFNEYLPSAEGFSDTVYICASGNRTIGYGTNISKNNIEMLLESNYLNVDTLGNYTMSKYQAKRAAGFWIAENNGYFEKYAETYIGIPFVELPQEIKDFIVLICYKSGGRGLLDNKRETARLIGDFIDSGMDTDSELFENMIESAGGDQNRKCVYRSIFK